MSNKITNVFVNYLVDIGLLSESQKNGFLFLFNNFGVVVRKTKHNTQETFEKRKIVSALNVYLQEINAREQNFIEDLCNRIMNTFSNKQIDIKLNSCDILIRKINLAIKCTRLSLFRYLLKNKKNSHKNSSNLKHEFKNLKTSSTKKNYDFNHSETSSQISKGLNTYKSLENCNHKNVLNKDPQVKLDYSNYHISTQSNKTEKLLKVNKLEDLPSLKNSTKLKKNYSTYLNCLKNLNNSFDNKDLRINSSQNKNIRNFHYYIYDKPFFTRQSSYSKNKTHNLLKKKIENEKEFCKLHTFKPNLIPNKYDGYDFKTINNTFNLDSDSYYKGNSKNKFQISENNPYSSSENSIMNSEYLKDMRYKNLYEDNKTRQIKQQLLYSKINSKIETAHQNKEFIKSNKISLFNSKNQQNNDKQEISSNYNNTNKNSADFNYIGLTDFSNIHMKSQMKIEDLEHAVNESIISGKGEIVRSLKGNQSQYVKTNENLHYQENNYKIPSKMTNEAARKNLINSENRLRYIDELKENHFIKYK